MTSGGEGANAHQTSSSTFLGIAHSTLPLWLVSETALGLWPGWLRLSTYRPRTRNFTGKTRPIND